MWIVALVLFVAAGVLAWIAYKQHRRALAMAVTHTVRCVEVASGPCEVVGAAAPAGGTPLVAPFSGTHCVWHRSTVTEHYWDWEWRGSGSNRRRERVRKQKKVSDERSPANFLLDDGTGCVHIDTSAAQVDRPRQVFDRFRDAGSGGGWNLSIGPFDRGGGDSTIGWAYEEWVILPGERLYVLGRAERIGDVIEIGRPEDGELLVSTRSEAELTKITTRNFWLAAGAASVAAAIATGLIALTVL